MAQHLLGHPALGRPPPRQLPRCDPPVGARPARRRRLYCVVDLHALTLDIDPDELRRSTLELAVGLLAAGSTPRSCTLFVQSHVPEHTRLSWLLECTATDGELRRMTQFKEKAPGSEAVRGGLLTYPVLMAADILLYDTDLVPVGDDQRQHLELTRERGRAVQQPLRRDLRRPRGAPSRRSPPGSWTSRTPTNKMSKSVDSPLGTVRLSRRRRPTIARKVRRAVTDTDGEVRYDPDEQAGRLQPARDPGRGHRRRRRGRRRRLRHATGT